MTSVQRWPLWIRFTIALISSVAIFVAIVIYVHDHQAQSLGNAAAPNAAQAAETEQEDRIVVQQEQAPHVVRFAAGTPPLTAAASAVSRFMAMETARGLITGPVVGAVSCSALGLASGRISFLCQTHAGPRGMVLRYPFQGTVAPGAQRVTYCQVVTPPYPLSNVPLSAACR